MSVSTRHHNIMMSGTTTPLRYHGALEGKRRRDETRFTRPFRRFGSYLNSYDFIDRLLQGMLVICFLLLAFCLVMALMAGFGIQP